MRLPNPRSTLYSCSSRRHTQPFIYSFHLHTLDSATSMRRPLSRQHDECSSTRMRGWRPSITSVVDSVASAHTWPYLTSMLGASSHASLLFKPRFATFFRDLHNEDERWLLNGNALDCRSRGCGFHFHPRQKFDICRALALRVHLTHSVKWVPA